MIRLLWRRNLISNLVGLASIIVLIALYITLLRYSKTTGTTRFNLNPKKVRYSRQVNSGHHGFWFQVPVGSRRGKQSHVYLVEEHHEVLPVWFDAARNGYIPVHGNTLIHIDGHNNMVPPYFLSRYPAWRMPRDNPDIHVMMQKNDAFIVEAAMAGLIKKVIWVWPLWDNKHHHLPEEKAQGEVGWATVDDTRHGKHKVFCLCKQNKTSPGHVRECVYLPLDSSSSRAIKPSHCHVKKTFQYIEVREDKVVEKLRDGSLLEKSETVLLDIDEDYYGSVFSSKPLLHSNLTLNVIHQIDRIVKRLFCPKNSHQEKDADQVLVTALNIFKKPFHCSKHNISQKSTMKRNKTLLFNKYKKQRTAQSKKASTTPTPCKTDSRIKEAESLLRKHLWNNVRVSYSCSSRNSGLDKQVKDLINYFLQLTSQQIRSLQYIGFCMTSSPKTLKILSNTHFKICHGQSLPNNNVHVEEFMPHSGDIFKRTKHLQQMLYALKDHRPKLTTVFRSIRDGFTPRRYFNRIENDVIKTLNTTLKNLHIHYDADLLGGKKGWPNRHKIPP